jgi:O-antigen/teichoic acid export membrane protein
MNLLKKLAGQTAIYGISSILGRLLTYLLVPVHTAFFLTAQFGTISLLYYWVAIFNVLYTFGMETTYFRFTTREKSDRPYHLTATAVTLVGLLISSLLILFTTEIALWLEIPEKSHLITWLAVIMFLDAVVAIPFARLRIENRPRVFAAIKMGAILLQVGLNLLYLYYIPNILKGEFLSSFRPLAEKLVIEGWDIEYVFFANLVSSALTVLLLIPYLLKIKPTFQWAAFKPMFSYGLPVLLTGFAGMFNERLGILIFEYVLPEGFYENLSTKGAIGVYSASEKLSIFMMLAIQAFRYAGEPFFFSQAADKNAPELFAKVMDYFVILCAIILVGVSLNVELIGQEFLKQASYRQALFLVPILLCGKLFFGVYVNLSVWFKLTDKTYYGTLITCVGALVTIVVNLLLIPYLGYVAIALGVVGCYFTMAIMCYILGRKQFPIPYNTRYIMAYILSAIFIVILAYKIELENLWMNHAVNIFITLVYIFALLYMEKRKITTKTQ